MPYSLTIEIFSVTKKEKPVTTTVQPESTTEKVIDSTRESETDSDKETLTYMTSQPYTASRGSGLNLTLHLTLTLT